MFSAETLFKAVVSLLCALVLLVLTVTLKQNEKRAESKAAELDSVKTELEAQRAATNAVLSRFGEICRERETAAETEDIWKEPSGGTTPQARRPDGRRVCYLTFDDGPSDKTLEILDILGKYRVKATFFVIESGNIEYVKKIYEAGHTIGLHTASHDYSVIYSGEEMFYRDITELSDKIYELIGVRPTLLRFPGGSSNTVSRNYCRGIMTRLVKTVGGRGYSYFDWNISSGDAENPTPSYTYIRNRVLTSAADKNSACILMHDSADKASTVQALPEIIEGMLRMGYSIEPLKSDTYGYHHRNLNN